MKDTPLTAVLLTKPSDLGGIRQRYTHIPANLAVRGKEISLQIADNIWDTGWLVEEVYGERKPIDHHKAIKQHRKNTGDSLV